MGRRKNIEPVGKALLCSPFSDDRSCKHKGKSVDLRGVMVRGARSASASREEGGVARMFVAGSGKDLILDLVIPMSHQRFSGKGRMLECSVFEPTPLFSSCQQVQPSPNPLSWVVEGVVLFLP